MGQDPCYACGTCQRAPIVSAMDQANTPRRAPQVWLDELALAEADLAAGRVEDIDIDIDALCAELEADADAMDAARRESRISRRSLVVEAVG